jgi:hypothetical protein
MKDYCNKLIKNKNSDEWKTNNFKKIYEYLLNNIVKIVDFKVTNNIVKKTFKLLDKVYFKNNISKFIRDTDSTITFNASSKLKKTAGFCKWNTYIDKYGDFDFGIYEIQISKPIIDNLFTDKKINSLKINGLNCFDRLECYINLFQHEITHLLINIFCSNEGQGMGGHTIMFKNIVYNLFGHTEYKHMLLSGDSLKLEEEELYNYTNMEIGDKVVTKPINGKKYKGVVTKLTKKFFYLKLSNGKIYSFRYSMADDIKKKNNTRKIKTEKIPVEELKKKLKLDMFVYVKLKNKLKKGQIYNLGPKRATIIFDKCNKWYIPYEHIILK